MTPDFISANEFINDEKYKKYSVDEEQYQRIRIELLKQLLKNKSKK